MDERAFVRAVAQAWMKASGKESLHDKELQMAGDMYLAGLDLNLILRAIELWAESGGSRYKTPYLWNIKPYIKKARALKKRASEGLNPNVEGIVKEVEITDHILAKLLERQAEHIKHFEFPEAYRLEDEICERAWELADQKIREEAYTWAVRKIGRLKRWNPPPEVKEEALRRASRRKARRLLGIPEQL